MAFNTLKLVEKVFFFLFSKPILLCRKPKRTGRLLEGQLSLMLLKALILVKEKKSDGNFIVSAMTFTHKPDASFVSSFKSRESEEYFCNIANMIMSNEPFLKLRDCVENVEGHHRRDKWHRTICEAALVRVYSLSQTLQPAQPP